MYTANVCLSAIFLVPNDLFFTPMLLNGVNGSSQREWKFCKGEEEWWMKGEWIFCFKFLHPPVPVFYAKHISKYNGEFQAF